MGGCWYRDGALRLRARTVRCEACGKPLWGEAGGLYLADPGQGIRAAELAEAASIACPCGHRVAVDAAFLIRQGDRWIYIPAQGTTASQDRDELDHLLGLAGDVFEMAEDTDVRVMSCERYLAPAALSPDPEVRAACDGLPSLLAAASRAEVEDLMESHPELLSHAAIRAYELIREADPAGDLGVTGRLRQWTDQVESSLRADETGAVGQGTLAKAQQALEDWRATGAPWRLEAGGALNAIARQQLAGTGSAQLSFEIDFQRLQYLAWCWTRTGAGADRDALMAAEAELIAGLAGSPAEAGGTRAIVAIAHSMRYERTADPELGDAAIARFRQALVETPAGHVARIGYLANLAAVLGFRSTIAADPDALSEAIDLLGQALEGSDDVRERPVLLGNLSNLMQDRYDAGGNLADLNAAVAAAADALAALPKDDPDPATCLAMLAMRLTERHRSLGGEDDLLGAVILAERAIRLTPDSHPLRAHRLHLASTTLSEMHARFGSLGHLDMAIALATAAVKQTPVGDPVRRTLLCNLSVQHLDRCHRVGGLEDLEKAVEMAEAALAETPADDPSRGSSLTAAAMALSVRFDRLGRREDLDAAIAAAAASSEGVDRSRRPSRLSNLAVMLRAAYLDGRNPGDLDRALETATKALAEGARPGPERARLLGLAAELHELRWALTAGQEDLAAALAFAADAIAEYRLLVTAEREISDVGRQLGEVGRRQMRMLAQCGRLRELVELVEGARMLRLRAAGARIARLSDTGLPDAEEHRALADEDRAARELLFTGAMAPGSETGGSDWIELSQAVLRLTSAGGAPGARKPAPLYEPDYAAIAALARRRGETFVYLVALDDGGGTLCLQVPPDAGDAPEPDDMLWVRDFDRDRLIELIAGDEERAGWLTTDQRHKDGLASDAQWFAGIEDLLETLGTQLMTKLAERLDARGARSVTLIPTGVFGFIPLHAAPAGASGEPFSERFEIRYAASASALLDIAVNIRLGAEARAKDEGGPSVAAILDPRADLPFASVYGDDLATLYGPRLEAAFNVDATWTWLSEAAARADILDISSHAEFDHDHIGMSAILLSEAGDREELSLSQVLRGELPLKPGALLIANCCETGHFDVRAQSVEDQLGFPSAFLMAGAATVVATFWRVADLSSWIAGILLHAELRAGARPAPAMRQVAIQLRQMDRDMVIAHVERAQALCRKTLARTRSRARAASAESALDHLAQERRRLSAAARDARPFAHPFYWAAYGVHGHG